MAAGVGRRTCQWPDRGLDAGAGGEARRGHHRQHRHRGRGSLFQSPDLDAARTARTRRYDKRHLFRMAHEQDHYSAGTRRAVVELNGWKVMPLVCYDLRFPVWSRNRLGADGGYDLLLYVANWPERRRYRLANIDQSSSHRESELLHRRQSRRQGRRRHQLCRRQRRDRLSRPADDGGRREQEFVTTVTLDQSAGAPSEFPAPIEFPSALWTADDVSQPWMR